MRPGDAGTGGGRGARDRRRGHDPHAVTELADRAGQGAAPDVWAAALAARATGLRAGWELAGPESGGSSCFVGA